MLETALVLLRQKSDQGVRNAMEQEDLSRTLLLTSYHIVTADFTSGYSNFNFYPFLSLNLFLNLKDDDNQKTRIFDNTVTADTRLR